MAQRKKETSFYPWVDVKDHSKGFKMNFSTVIYLELGRTSEGYKQAEFKKSSIGFRLCLSGTFFSKF